MSDDLNPGLPNPSHKSSVPCQLVEYCLEYRGPPYRSWPSLFKFTNDYQSLEDTTKIDTYHPYDFLCQPPHLDSSQLVCVTETALSASGNMDFLFSPVCYKVSAPCISPRGSCIIQQLCNSHEDSSRRGNSQTEQSLLSAA